MALCAAALSAPWYLQGRYLLGEDEIGSLLLGPVLSKRYPESREGSAGGLGG